MMKRSPRLSVSVASVSRLPRERIASTPESETATPASWIADKRWRRNTHESAMIITGMNEFRILSEDGKTISFGAFIDEAVMKLDQTKDLEFEGEDFFIQIDKPGEYIVKFDAKNARKPTLVVRPLTAPTS